MKPRPNLTETQDSLASERSGATGVGTFPTGLYWSVEERKLVFSGDLAGLCFGLEAIRSAGAETVNALQRLSEQWSDTVHRRSA